MTTSHISLPELSDGRVLLRPVDARDLPGIEAGTRDPDVIRWIGPQQPSAQDALRRDEAWLEKGSPTLAICHPDGTFVGKVWLTIPQTDRSTGFVGYWLLPVARGCGLATSAVRLISIWAVRELGIRDLRISAAPDNERSHRVAERSGFRRLDPRAEASPHGHAGRDVVFALDTTSL